MKTSIWGRVRARLLPEARAIWKRWSTQLVALGVVCQTVWAAMTPETRAMFPRPEVIGLMFGLAALVAMFLRQGKAND